VIGAKRVTAPDGTVWRVGRRWLPDKPVLWRRKRRDGDRGGEWLINLGGEGAADAVGIALLVGGIAARLVFRDDAAALALGHTDVQPSEAGV
jgi:hypothetical protein